MATVSSLPALSLGILGPQIRRKETKTRLAGPFETTLTGRRIVIETFQRGEKILAMHRVGRRPAVVACSRLDGQQDSWEREWAAELQAARKTHAHLALKLLTEGLSLFNVCAHWGGFAGERPGETFAADALLLALLGGVALVRPCVRDLRQFSQVVKDCAMLSEALPKAEWALDWDSEDEESLEVQRERVLLLTMGGVCLEALLALLWAVCNCAFPPSGDADVWLRCLWLLAFRSTLPGLFCLRWANAWRWK